MAQSNKINDLITNILKESLGDKVVEVTKNIKKRLHESVCEECGKEICECGYMEEEMKEEDKSTACESYKYHLETFGEDDERTQEFKMKCGEGEELGEELHGNQYKLDKNKNGKLDKKDFEMLRGDKELSEDKQICNECGSGYMTEGVCNECGYTMSDEEMEEGNAFTDKLRKTKKGEKFKLGDKIYTDKSSLEEAEKFIQKAMKKMKKKGTEGSFKEFCGGEVTKSCIDKGLKSDDPKIVKKANFAKNIKAYKGATHESNNKSLSLTEDELVDLIESIVMEQKAIKNDLKGEKKNQSTNIKTQKPKGLQVYDKVHNLDKKENDNYLSSLVKKFKDYLKDGSKGTYEMNPKHFPKGNGELAKMNKKAYVPSEAVDEYIDAFSHPGQTNLRYDEIKPNDENIEKYLKGDSKTGNSQKYANAVETEVGDKFLKNYKDNLYGAEQADASYKRQSQPVDVAGERTQKGKLKSKKTSKKKADNILNQLESTEENKSNKLNEEFEKISKLMNYNGRTQ